MKPMAKWAYFSFYTKLSHLASSLFLIFFNLNLIDKELYKFPQARWLIHTFITGFQFLLFFPMLYFPFSFFYPLLSTTSRIISYPDRFSSNLFLAVVYPPYFFLCLYFYHLFYQSFFSSLSSFFFFMFSLVSFCFSISTSFLFWCLIQLEQLV